MRRKPDPSTGEGLRKKGYTGLLVIPNRDRNSQGFEPRESSFFEEGDKKSFELLEYRRESYNQLRLSFKLLYHYSGGVTGGG